MQLQQTPEHCSKPAIHCWPKEQSLAAVRSHQNGDLKNRNLPLTNTYLE